MPVFSEAYTRCACAFTGVRALPLFPAAPITRTFIEWILHFHVCASTGDCADRYMSPRVRFRKGKKLDMRNKNGRRHFSQMTWIKKRPTTSITAQVTP
jgi:hypothetical protein